jgi:uncharacterized protein (TIRG00374 family)
LSDTGRAPRVLSRALGLLVRLGFAGGLTAYILWKSHPRDVMAAASGAHWGPIALAILLVLVDRTLMAYRWVALLYALRPDSRQQFTAVMRIFFVSTFVGTFLPASVGGDAVRSYQVTKLNVSGGDAVASVFMDRMLGVASILIMAVAGLLIVRDLATSRIVVAGLMATAAICGATVLLIFSERVAKLIVTVLEAIPVAALHRVGSRIIESVRKYASHPRPLLAVLACSVGVQILRIVQAYYLGLGLGVTASPSAYFGFVPLILLVMLLPVTISGLGTSQAAFVWFFGQAGVPAASAFALSVLFVALNVVGNVPGALLYLAGPKTRQTSSLQSSAP